MVGARRKSPLGSSSFPSRQDPRITINEVHGVGLKGVYVKVKFEQ